MYIYIKKPKKQTNCALLPSGSLFLLTYYGTELSPLFPYLRAGLFKKGGGGGGSKLVDRFPVTYCSLKGSDPKVDPGLKGNFVSSVMGSPKSLVAYPPTRR